MSVRFESGSILQADYADSLQRVQSLPISVQCWLYVPEGVVPTVSTFWPIWTLGERHAQNYVALEAVRDQGDPTKLQLDAAFDGGTRVVVSIDGLDTGVWHLATVVVVDAGQGDAEVRLYVDDQSVVKQTVHGSVAAGTSPEGMYTHTVADMGRDGSRCEPGFRNTSRLISGSVAPPSKTMLMVGSL